MTLIIVFIMALFLFGEPHKALAFGCDPGNTARGYWKDITSQYGRWDRCIIPGPPEPQGQFKFPGYASRTEGKYKIITVISPASQELVGRQLVKEGWRPYAFYFDKDGKQASSLAECPSACIFGYAEWYVNDVVEKLQDTEYYKFSQSGQYYIAAFDDGRDQNVRKICYIDYVTQIFEWVCTKPLEPQKEQNFGPCS